MVFYPMIQISAFQHDFTYVKNPPIFRYLDDIDCSLRDIKCIRFYTWHYRTLFMWIMNLLHIIQSIDGTISKKLIYTTHKTILQICGFPQLNRHFVPKIFLVEKNLMKKILVKKNFGRKKKFGEEKNFLVKNFFWSTQNFWSP